MLLRDIRHAVRLLRRSPGFTAAAVLTLALGIGANTAVFTVVDAALLRPLPYGDPGRLVALWDSPRTGPRGGIATGNLEGYRRVRSFEGVAAYERLSMSLTRSGEPEQALGEAVTWNLTAVLGVPPALGRAFRSDDVTSGGRVVILMDGFWRRRFGADPSIVGRSIVLNDEAYEVVGVMPARFEPLSQPGSGFTIEYYVPADTETAPLGIRRAPQMSAAVRLAPGVSIEQARAELRVLSADLSRQLPGTSAPIVASIVPLREKFVREEVRRSLVVLLGAVGLVLLIACVNVGNLLIVRAVGQRREIAIRMAIGATRGRITRELATRGAVLGLLGGGAGLVLGLAIRRVLVSMAPPAIPGLAHITLDARVLAVTLGCSLAAGIAAALLPALQLGLRRSTPVEATMRSAALAIAGTRSVARWRGVLMAAEVAAALMLAVAAGLLVRSLVRLTSVELGFRTHDVLTFMIRLPPSRYPDADARLRFFEELERRLAGTPAVRGVAVADAFPMRGGRRSRVTVGGSVPPRSPITDYQIVSPGYFGTLGIPLARGRLLGAQDRTGAEPAAVVSDAFVRRFVADRDPIGARIRLGEMPAEMTIVGVVQDVRRDGKHAPIAPQVYVAAAQTDLYGATLEEVAVRAAGDPHALVPAVQRAVWSIDPDQPVTHVQTFGDMVARGTADRRFSATLLGAMAALAVALALVGVYGVAAHAAAQRTKEIGIRVALGATRRDVLLLVVSGGVKWAFAGILAGLCGAYASTRLMSGLLFDVPPTDAVTFAISAALVVGVATTASYVPARRAARADPVVALRAE